MRWQSLLKIKVYTYALLPGLNIFAITLAAAAIDKKYKDAPYYLDLAFPQLHRQPLS